MYVGTEKAAVIKVVKMQVSRRRKYKSILYREQLYLKSVRLSFPYNNEQCVQDICFASLNSLLIFFISVSP
jgi:hypothetical protein